MCVQSKTSTYHRVNAKSRGVCTAPNEFGSACREVLSRLFLKLLRVLSAPCFTSSAAPYKSGNRSNSRTGPALVVFPADATAFPPGLHVCSVQEKGARGGGGIVPCFLPSREKTRSRRSSSSSRGSSPYAKRPILPTEEWLYSITSVYCSHGLNQTMGRTSICHLIKMPPPKEIGPQSNPVSRNDHQQQAGEAFVCVYFSGRCSCSEPLRCRHRHGRALVSSLRPPRSSFSET